MRKLILILTLLISGCATTFYEPMHYQDICPNYILKEYNPSFDYSLWDRQRFFEKKIDCWRYRQISMHLQNMYEKE